MKYEEVGHPHIAAIALSSFGAQDALRKLGFEPPVLSVSPSSLPVAARVVTHCGLGLACDDTLSATEWYVEWNGKRVGNIGC